MLRTSIWINDPTRLTSLTHINAFMIRLFFLFASILFLSSCDCYRKVEGVVLDSLSKRPIQQAVVLNMDRHWVSQETDSSGKFVLTDLAGYKCPPMKVRISAAGYRTRNMLIRSGTVEVLMKQE